MLQTTDIALLDELPAPAEPDARSRAFAETHDPAAVDSIAVALESRHGASLTPSLRHEIARRALDHYRDAPVQSFVTILAHRRAVAIAAARLRRS
jgi:hypothetical protein